MCGPNNYEIKTIRFTSVQKELFAFLTFLDLVLSCAGSNHVLDTAAMIFLTFDAISLTFYTLMWSSQKISDALHEKRSLKRGMGKRMWMVDLADNLIECGVLAIILAYDTENRRFLAGVIAAMSLMKLLKHAIQVARHLISRNKSSEDLSTQTQELPTTIPSKEFVQ